MTLICSKTTCSTANAMKATPNPNTAFPDMLSTLPNSPSLGWQTEPSAVKNGKSAKLDGKITKLCRLHERPSASCAKKTKRAGALGIPVFTCRIAAKTGENMLRLCHSIRLVTAYWSAMFSAPLSLCTEQV